MYKVLKPSNILSIAYEYIKSHVGMLSTPLWGVATSGDRRMEGILLGQSSQKASACNVVIAKSEADTGVYEMLYFFKLIKVSKINHAFTFNRAGGGRYRILANIQHSPMFQTLFSNTFQVATLLILTKTP